jgi:hypothetical protein
VLCLFLLFCLWNVVRFSECFFTTFFRVFFSLFFFFPVFLKVFGMFHFEVFCGVFFTGGVLFGCV